MTRPDGSAPLEIEAPGGRVVVRFADPGAATGSTTIEAAVAMTRRNGPIGEIEGVIVAEAARLGLTAVVTGTRHPTTIVVSSRAATPDRIVDANVGSGSDEARSRPAVQRPSR